MQDFFCGCLARLSTVLHFLPSADFQECGLVTVQAHCGDQNIFLKRRVFDAQGLSLVERDRLPSMIGWLVFPGRGGRARTFENTFLSTLCDTVSFSNAPF